MQDDTPTKPRFTSSFEYTDDLEDARDAMMTDIEHIPEVEFNDIVTTTLPAVSSDLSAQVLHRLKRDKRVKASKGKPQWLDFLQPDNLKNTRKRPTEKATFNPLKEILDAIFEQVAPYMDQSFSILHYVDDGTHVLYSERSDTSHPDGYLQLKNTTLPAGDHDIIPKGAAWPDVAVSFKFKRDDSKGNEANARPCCAARRPRLMVAPIIGYDASHLVYAPYYAK